MLENRVEIQAPSEASSCKSAAFYLGIDGGGTKTRALLTDQMGQVRGVGRAGSANPNHYSREQARESLRDAIREAVRDRPGDFPLASVFLGMGGVSTDADREEIRSLVREIPEVGSSVRVTVDNDAVVGLTGGLSGKPGIALIAGTGSACFGINERGERWFCGGWGALADDVGSAPWMGLQSLRAAVRAEDDRDPPTLLRDIVFDFLKLAEPRQFIRRVHNDGLERAHLGRLAPLIVDAYQQGDEAARTIVRDAVEGLAEMVAVTVRRLFGDDPCPMILVGGLALSGPPFQSLLTKTIRKKTPHVVIFKPDMSPVQGAVLEALRAGGVSWTPSLLENVGSVSEISQI